MLEPKFGTFQVSDIRQAIKLSISQLYIYKIWDDSAFLRAMPDKGGEQPRCYHNGHVS